MPPSYQPDPTKHCRKCCVAKPHSEFAKDRRSRDGLQARCKLCAAIYNRTWYRKFTAQPRVAVLGGEKRCTKCRETKAINRFGKYLLSRDGRRAQCADCRSVSSSWSHIKRKFGLTRERYEAMLSDQDNRCAICERSDSGARAFHVDHDHATGAIRGLLCARCNIGLGYFVDNPAALLAAERYLQKTKRLRVA